MHTSVILLLSLDPTGGLCNDTRLTIRALLNRIIYAENATCVHKGKRVFIPRIPMTPTETDFPFVTSEDEVSYSSCILYNNQQRNGECRYIYFSYALRQQL